MRHVVTPDHSSITTWPWRLWTLTAA